MPIAYNSEHGAGLGSAGNARPAGYSFRETGRRYQRLPGLIPIAPAMGMFPSKPATVPGLISGAAFGTYPALPRLRAVKLSPADMRGRRGLPSTPPARPSLLAHQALRRLIALEDWGAPPGGPLASNPARRHSGEARSLARQGRRAPEPGRRRSVMEMWLAVQYFLAGRKLAQVSAILIVVILAGSFEYSSSGWPKLAAPGFDRPFHAAMAALQQPIKNRAAFFILEDFDGNGGEWLNTGSLRREAEGFATAGGLALRLDTMELSDYRLDFEARIRSRAVGWVVRAADTSNYYAFKLVENGARGPHLLRYPVIGGSRRGGNPLRVELPAKLARSDFNRVTVRVRGEHITTLVNGWGVDYWKDGALAAGGVGFLSENGETAVVRKMTVTGNDDTWGLILYGTLETLRTLEEHFGSGPLAFQLQPFPPGLPAAYRP